MARTPIISPLHDVSIAVGPIYTVPSTGTRTPFTAGTITGFLAATATATSAADPSFIATLTYIGGNSDGLGSTYTLGTWLYQLDGSVMVQALLDSLFGAADEAYLMVQRTNDIYCATRLEYQNPRRTVVV